VNLVVFVLENAKSQAYDRTSSVRTAARSFISVAIKFFSFTLPKMRVAIAIDGWGCDEFLIKYRLPWIACGCRVVPGERMALPNFDLDHQFLLLFLILTSVLQLAAVA